jgi:tRNA(Ile)-lysidine synthase
VNYHLRVPDSDREEKFLRDWAKQEDVPIHVRQLFPKDKPKNLQDWARQERYQFFRKIMEKNKKGSGVLCLAHQQNDQAETVLMRMMTGSGLKAMGGMRVWERNGVGVFCFRPFLTVSASAIQNYLQAHRQAFCHDLSNEAPDYLRNRVRAKILPLMLEENPRANEALIELGRKSREAQESLESLAQDWMARVIKGKGMDLPRTKLASLPRALRLTVLEIWLRRHIKETRNLGKILQGLENLLAHPQLSHNTPLPDGWALKLSPGAVRIEKAKGPFRPKGAKKGRKRKNPRKP